MRVAVLATASPQTIRQVVGQARDFFKDQELVIYLREAWHAELGQDLRDCQVRSDTVRGRWFRFWRELRRERFDSVAVIWAGGRDHWKLKLMGMLILPHNLYVFNENGNFFRIGKGSVGILRRHLSWRMSQAVRDASRVTATRVELPWYLKALLQLYAVSLGPILGAVMILLHFGLLDASRRWRRACAELRERDGAPRP